MSTTTPTTPSGSTLLEEDPAVVEAMFSGIPTAVTAVCAADALGRVGMVVASLTAVSWAPAVVTIAVQQTSNTWLRLRSARTIGLSVLSGEQAAVSAQLASRSRDRFASLPIMDRESGAVFVNGAIAHLEATLTREIEVGDHVLAVLEVRPVTSEHVVDGQPLVYHRRSMRPLTEL